MADVTLILAYEGVDIPYMTEQKRQRHARVNRVFDVYVGTDLAGQIVYRMGNRERNGKTWQTPGWFTQPGDIPSWECTGKQAAIDHVVAHYMKEQENA